MIRTDSDEYFIEPLERGTQEHEERGRVHVVYRRSAVLQAPSDISLDYHQIGQLLTLLTKENFSFPK
ncbi:A disintegrin and metalloproteinase with thrombospondin motifs 3 [Anabarilius grahami]|uniref:A disintegrin and metalloproteinase with thrombospondin motifs 3 n=1 Tax=Anabarilius grahami TaxID=495550 RepID=A0A3N0Z0D8_ANAGA|nr:A disintegrin and metalloproteinase with thrombospondin motifs 3 [Anabarilius grahami]